MVFTSSRENNEKNVRKAIIGPKDVLMVNDNFRLQDIGEPL